MFDGAKPQCRLFKRQSLHPRQYTHKHGPTLVTLYVCFTLPHPTTTMWCEEVHTYVPAHLLSEVAVLGELLLHPAVCSPAQSSSEVWWAGQAQEPPSPLSHSISQPGETAAQRRRRREGSGGWWDTAVSSDGTEGGWEGGKGLSEQNTHIDKMIHTCIFIQWLYII